MVLWPSERRVMLIGAIASTTTTRMVGIAACCAAQDGFWWPGSMEHLHLNRKEHIGDAIRRSRK